MKRMIVILLTGMLLACITRADAPAVHYYVLKSSRLKEIVEKTSLDRLDYETLSKDAVLSGGIHGYGTTFSVKTKDSDISVSFGMNDDVGIASSNMNYRFYLYDKAAQKEVLHIRGEASRHGELHITDKWEQEPFAVIFQFINLKK